MKLDDLVYKLAQKGAPTKVLPQFIEESSYLWTKVSVPANGKTVLTVYYNLPEPPKDPFNDGSEIAFYRFNGNANDEYGNYNGTWSGNEQYGVGVWGQGARFDGSSYIYLQGLGNNLPANNNPRTISFWAKGKDIQFGGNFAHVFAYGNHSNNQFFGVGICPNKHFHIHKWGNVYDCIFTQTFIEDSNFHFYTFVVVGNNDAKLFVDGVYKETKSVNLSTVLNDNAVVGSRDHNAMTEGIRNCFIDNLRIFNRALSDEEVQQLYELEKPYIVSNGDEVFEFFDDFDGDDLDSSKWQEHADYISLNNSVITCHNGSVNLHAYSTADGGKVPELMKFRLVVKEKSNSGYSRYGCMYADTSIGNTGDSNNTYSYAFYEGSNSRWTSNLSCGNNSALANLSVYSWHTVEITYDGNEAKFYFNGNYRCSCSNSNWKLKGIRLYSCREYLYDRVVLTKFVNPEPSITYGNEETGNWIIDGVTYTKRKKVTITNNSSEDLVDYQVRLDLSEFGESQQVRVME